MRALRYSPGSIWHRANDPLFPEVSVTRIWVNQPAPCCMETPRISRSTTITPKGNGHVERPTGVRSELRKQTVPALIWRVAQCRDVGHRSTVVAMPSNHRGTDPRFHLGP